MSGYFRVSSGLSPVQSLRLPIPGPRHPIERYENFLVPLQQSLPARVVDLEVQVAIRLPI